MKYKISENKGCSDIKHEILSRRGVEDPEHYLNTNDKDILSYSLLGDSINQAYRTLKQSIENKEKIKIYSDPDADGMFSSAMLYSYIKKAFGLDLEYYSHDSKQHGLGDKELFSKVVEDAKSGNLDLLLIPDSSTNDYKEAKILSDLGCKTILFDHHIVEKNKNEHSIIINPQLIENYSNPDSSGTLITWKFLKAIDDFEWTNYADDYLDLVAFSIISDGMDIRNIENRHLITLGLENIKNKFLLELINNDYRIKNSPPTIIDVSFFVVPLINGTIRSGSELDKQIMFQALCEKDESFEYVKRDKTIVQESVYARALRLCTNSKSRQDRAIDKGMEIILEDIEKFKRNDNKILFALCDDRVDRAFTGLIAQRLASKFNKPVVLLRKNEKGDYFSGSIRNFQDSPLTNLKGFLESLGYASFLSGHMNASGVGYSKKQLLKSIELSNEKLKDYSFEKIHNIDYEFDFNKKEEILILDNMLLPIHNFKKYWGQGIPEAKILIKNIGVKSSDISFFGAREKSEIKNNWKFELKDGVDILNFHADENDVIYKKYGSGNNEGFNWDGDDLFMDVICKIARTEYNGERRWAFIIEEYRINE